MRQIALILFMLLLWLHRACAIGLSIPPVLLGDQKRCSSPRNLDNCVSYLTCKDDMITVNIKAGETIASQELNLNVFDSQKNILRSLTDLAHDQVVMFTNLDYQTSSKKKKWKSLLDFHYKNKDAVTFLAPPDTKKNYVHICFDNIYSDRSWSFQKQQREIIMSVDIRSLSSLKKTNYKKYSKYFNQASQTTLTGKGPETEPDFFNESFESAVKQIKNLLQEASDEIEESNKKVQNLKRNERLLRDLNEEILENYNKTATLLLFTISSLGVAQIFYFKFYFKRLKLI